MPSRARDRHLAKNAERRRQERRQAKRNRTTAFGVGGAIAVVLIVLGVLGLLSRRDAEQAGDGATPSASVTGDGPKQTGTVKPQATPPEQVACGGDVPAAASKPKPQFNRAPTPDEVLTPDTTYTATIETSCGPITIELDAKAAPKTVASFVFLAQQGYFDGTFFHRVVDSIDVVQGGDPTGTGSGGPGYTIPDELAGKQHYATGTVAMANAGPDSGGSQFFLITGPQGENLDAVPNYTIFGQITDGLDVAQQINGLLGTDDGSYDGPPTEAVYIESVTIESSS